MANDVDSDQDLAVSVAAWFRSLTPLKVDVVGDYAGKELFAIHGDSMIAYCLSRAKVDYDGGLQLVHGIHAIEIFLDNLQRRGCNFHIVWFDDQQELCVPPSAANPEAYHLTRAVIIKHLQRHGEHTGDQISFRFAGMDPPEFDKYLKNNAVHFFMCLDGHEWFGPGKKIQHLHSLAMVYQMGLRGYSVAFLDTLEFVSSKVYASVASPSTQSWNTESLPAMAKPSRPPIISLTELERKAKWRGDNTSLFDYDDQDLEHDREYDHDQGHFDGHNCEHILTARETVALITISNMLHTNPTSARKRCAGIYVSQLALLKTCPLRQRPGIIGFQEYEGPDLESFLSVFCSISAAVIDDEANLSGLHWDLPDLLDGRMLWCAFFLADIRTRIPDEILGSVRPLAERIRQLTGFDVLGAICQQRPFGPREGMENSFGRAESPRVLPFRCAVLDEYLKEVSICPTFDPEEDPSFHWKVFREITHWHNAKNPVDPKKQLAKKPDFRALRKNQRFMADTLAYSASLTNSTGKLITPQTIVVQPAGKESGQKGQGHHKSKGPIQKKQNGTQKSGGRQNAMKEARRIEDRKREQQAKGALVAWNDRFSELEAERDLVKRFVAVTRYLAGLSAVASAAVKGEAAAYGLNALAKILLKRNRSGRRMEKLDLDIIAIIWRMILELRPASVSKDVATYLAVLGKVAGLSVAFAPDASQKRRLPFLMIPIEQLSTIILPLKSLDFELTHCGPYLERSFDPTPDSRVRFTPDAWQRKVLDGIDANKSLLVIAPTSSGKTFISFYAMKKILQSGDDDVLVYVAPTKALVNQIAAEIQAEFSKSYKHTGRCIWAIHTRDYRVNNPTGCQILVTVPHILEIMLLAPANSTGKNSWAQRVKSIIFDEVHCIGQAEDGVIWEHLLLLAPCPIIALSATVGNPLEFKEWLEGTQKAKGFELEMIVHNSRYSDLRKFLYFPPKTYQFNGLQARPRLPIPGLDTGDAGSRFVFIHPIVALANRNRGALDDISLEPRDCFELFQCMVNRQTVKHPIPDTLHPRNFVSGISKKADVVKWQIALKKTLGEWMRDADSPFTAVQQALRHAIVHRKPASALDQDILPSNKTDTTAFSVSAKHLSSFAFPLLLDLHRDGGLPALLFDYDRSYCEHTAFTVLRQLQVAEEKWKASSPEWKKKLSDFETYQKDTGRRPKTAKVKKPEEGASKLDMLREEASVEASVWKSFDPNAPLREFSFADHTKLLDSELQKHANSLAWIRLKEELIDALKRGIGVHHSGMNRHYRQVVEMLFRKGFLTVVIATGTLALGINMPCKTVVFFGDSVFLTALSYQQGSGRAGRRGFDLLGNVVFTGMKPSRACEIMSSRLPDIQGHFPLSTTLILRLLGLLHHTQNSEFAVNAVTSMLSQTRLYLGGPSDQLAIKHHVRFSIEYLRRQGLLSRDAVPLNFAGLVGHLYFTENAVFAFHSLMKEGYFYELCRHMHTNPKEVLLEIVLALSHLFCRIPVRKYQDKRWLAEVVRPSTSVVLLPALPERAAAVLRQHNQETLDIFKAYVSTYVKQHLEHTPDTTLPFTGCDMAPQVSTDYDFRPMLGSWEPITLRSPFTALSGFNDNFDSIGDLCATVRSGVFLEESAIPYIPIYPADTDGVPWNAYIYDFFKHGSLDTLVKANGIKSGDVWFHLKDFSLVLATIVTSLTNFFELEGVDMLDVQGGGDGEEHPEDLEEEEVVAKPAVRKAGLPVYKKKTKKAKVADSWDDDLSDDGDEKPSKPVHGGAEKDGGWEEGSQGQTKIEDNDLMMVLVALRKLQAEFDDKFRKVWA